MKKSQAQTMAYFNKRTTCSKISADGGGYNYLVKFDNPK